MLERSNELSMPYPCPSTRRVLLVVPTNGVGVDVISASHINWIAVDEGVYVSRQQQDVFHAGFFVECRPLKCKDMAIDDGCAHRMRVNAIGDHDGS